MSLIIDVDTTIQQLVLEKLKLQQRLAIPRHMLDNAEVNTMAEYVTDQMLIGMHTYVTAGSWTEKTPTGEVRNYWVFPEIPPNPDRNICKFLVSYYGKGKR